MLNTLMKPGSGQWPAAAIFRGAIRIIFVLFVMTTGCSLIQSFARPTATPESQGFDSVKLEKMWNELQARNTSVFLIIRNNRIVFERYGKGFSRTTPHYTASLAKSLVGSLSLMLAMDDGLMRPDDLASKFVPQWKGASCKGQITLRELATHTSGLEDAEANGLPHERLMGWKGDFWKELPPPHDPFTISRDVTPVLDPPGTRLRYANPGFAMLVYCLTASLRGAPQSDLRSLLKQRIMDPLGIPPNEWSVGYDMIITVDDLPLVAAWGGGNFSPSATARIGLLLLDKGVWNGQQLISRATIEQATHYAGMPNHSGLGWLTNRKPDGTRFWSELPGDAFWGEVGAGGQFLLVVPSLSLIVVRYGGALTKTDDSDSDIHKFVVAPLMRAFAHCITAPYPPSRAIHGIEWADKSAIIRLAPGSDNWPMTWADNDSLYTAYGDGNGFRPFVPNKLSLGFARVEGFPTNITGVNIRSSSGEQTGNGPSGRKASGLLMVDNTIYMWTRNASNSQLAWSANHARTWTWSSWRFTNSFGCPAFLNFGRNYAGARDGFVYVYSPDTSTAYSPADRLVLARVPEKRIRERVSYEFFVRLESNGKVVWSPDITERGAVFCSPHAVGRSHVSYDSGLKRYLLTIICTGTNASSPANLGVFDAPEPWGPWTTVFYTDTWDVAPGESADFPPKGFSPDGRSGWLVFSGKDSFSTRRATFILIRGASR